MDDANDVLIISASCSLVGAATSILLDARAIRSKKFRELSFLVYGLGSTGRSVVNFFKKNSIKNYQVWDDNHENLFKKKRPTNLKQAFKEVDYIILSPGISLINSKFKRSIWKKNRNRILAGNPKERFQKGSFL